MITSPCANCRWFSPEIDEDDICAAYPRGIPTRIFAAGSHDVVQRDQVGTFVAESPKED